MLQQMSNLSQYLNVDDVEVDSLLENFDTNNVISLQNSKDIMNIIRYVENEHDLIEFVGQKVVGIDIEQSRKLGYDGQICLIQIKFGEMIYILDIITLSLQNQKLQSILRRMFEDENIIKVFYGGQQDLLWIQRDFQITVKGYCDIKVLVDVDKQKLDKSLVNMWNIHCEHEFDKNQKKQFQESDWHLRPLTAEQIQYAALDAFFLPYLRYKLLHDMIQTNNTLIILQTALLKTHKQQSKIYSKERKTDLHFMNNLEKKILPKISINYNEMAVFKYYYSQLCLLKQELHLQQNSQMMEDDLLNTYPEELRSIPNLQSFAQFSAESDAYNHDPLLWLQEQDKSSNWQILRQDFVTNLLHKFMNDAVFTQSCINHVYRVQQFKELQKEADILRKEIKQKRFLVFQDKFTCHKPVYGECKILAQDGTLLCVCDRKKVLWYLKNELADTITEVPLVIQLRFQPSGLQEMNDKEQIENKFYTASRENQCVVCGAKNNYMKYHIVPVIYKRFFENHFKSHRSHDVLLLCLRCHEKASASVDKLKDQIAKKYNQPVVQLNQNQQLMDNIRQLKKQTLTYKNKQFLNKEDRAETKLLLRQVFQEVINDERIKSSTVISLEQLTLTKSNKFKINQAFIELCLLIKTHQETFRDSANNNSKFNLHGMQVVEQLTQEKDIEDFIMVWRSHFLQTMNPQFLPAGWSVDHKFKRQFGVKSVFYKDSQN